MMWCSAHTPALSGTDHNARNDLQLEERFPDATTPYHSIHRCLHWAFI
jgi:hypothetical protein